MSRTVSQPTVAALARVMAGEDVSSVSRATGIHRSTLHRRLKAGGLSPPKQGKRGRPAKTSPAEA